MTIRYVDPENGDEYEPPAGDHCFQFLVSVLGGVSPGGNVAHLLRVELYPLPCDHPLIDRIVEAMNQAAVEVLEQNGHKLELEAVIDHEFNKRLQ